MMVELGDADVDFLAGGAMGREATYKEAVTSAPKKDGVVAGG